MPSVSGIARPCTERTCMYMRVQRRPIVLFIEPSVLRNHQATILVKPMLQISERDACVTQTSRAPGPASNMHYMSQVLNLVLYEPSVESCCEHIKLGIARHIFECCTLLHESGIARSVWKCDTESYISQASHWKQLPWVRPFWKDLR